MVSPLDCELLATKDEVARYFYRIAGVGDINIALHLFYGFLSSYPGG
jgi:hypothetical protein